GLRQQAEQRLGRGFGVADRIYADALVDGRFDPQAHGLGDDAAARWRVHFAVTLPRLVRKIEEPHPAYPDSRTTKVVLATADDLEIESVIIPMGPDKHTLCVSSQVGCKRACRFCETGKMGFLRDLTAAEIVGQVVTARTVLGARITNIVFMGMGEALDNADAVLQALRVLNDSRGLGYGQQRITVCTVGNPEGLAKLAAHGYRRLNLSISLNAATNAQRNTLMPINRRYPLPVLQQALQAHPRRSSFVYAINYCLMPGLNDQREDARAVAAFVAPLGRSLVNVIPYNPGSEPLTRAPTESEVETFVGWLIEDGVAVRRRVTKGRSMMAACGQLGNLALRRRRAAEDGGTRRDDHAPDP
ncbi:MAG: 23S rRNA (adenine(2503)-C(2))-methyltransferase RlmN, partial [Myxococcota bacterium]